MCCRPTPQTACASTPSPYSRCALDGRLLVRNSLITHAVLQSVTHAFSLVTRHFPRALNRLRINRSPNTVGVRCDDHTTGTRGSRGNQEDGDSIAIRVFCRDIFRSIAGAVVGNFAAGTRSVLSPQRTAHEPDRGRFRHSPARHTERFWIPCGHEVAEREQPASTNLTTSVGVLIALIASTVA